MFYASSCVLFKTIGFGDNASLLLSVITGGINALATSVSVYATDGCVYCLEIWGIWWDYLSTKMACWCCGVVVLFICIYIQAFAWSWRPLGWLVPSEIFPLEIRSAAVSLTNTFLLLKSSSPWSAIWNLWVLLLLCIMCGTHSHDLIHLFLIARDKMYSNWRHVMNLE